ncbi:MAG: hypothetical protein ACM308_01345 [Qipengyuania vulgaris]
MRLAAFLGTYRKAIRRRVYLKRGLGLRGQPESVAAFFAFVISGMLWSQGYSALAIILGLLVVLPAVALAAFVEWTAFRTHAEKRDKIYERHTRKMLSDDYNRLD